MAGAADPGAIDLDEARRLLAPDLFDAAFYRGEAGLSPDDDAFAHYFVHGSRARIKPNPVFDPRWYVAENPEAAAADPLLHYALIGEPQGRDPSALFDVAWYRGAYGAERPLAHYLAHRFGPFSPVPEFDAAFYLQTNPDVAAAGMDPFLHYLHFGFRDFRKPRAGFNPRLYALRFLAGQRGANPIVHMRANRSAAPQARPSGPYEETRFFARRGPRYEPPAPAPEQPPKALVLAYHLTQYHRIPENDAWWGEGYTEWTQLARGTPRFAGHYQPRIPGALGFYDLTDAKALRAQARLAKSAGIGGFVFYYYDFDGKRLLERPLELFLSLPDIDIGFCLMWANENWTRRWDGAEDEALITQSYDEASEATRAAELARHFRDPRYIRLEGRPLLMVYRASLIPDTPRALERWRRQFAELGESPIFVMAQTFDDIDPRPLGFDGAIEFPPHKLTRGLPHVYEQLDIFDEGFEADAFAYDDLVEASLAEAAPDFPLIKTAVPSWDNDSRRQGQGLTLVGSTPRKFELWLSELVENAQPWFGTGIVAVNAWNEWSEGAYLEPDAHFGHAYLNAAARAIRAAAPPRTQLAAAGETARGLACAFGVEIIPGPALDGDDAPPADEARLREMFASLWPQTPRVSVFVLHRGGDLSPLRLRSLLAQTHPVWEVIVLDAGESALEAVDAEARAADRDVALGLDIDDGLRRAAEMASGEFVWIVESNGYSDPTCLAALAADRQAAFAFCDSRPADSRGRPLHRRPNALAASRRSPAFTDRTLDGAEFLAWSAQAPAPELSAILWRRDALAAALAAFPEGEVDVARLVAEAAAAPQSRIRWVAEALNTVIEPAAPGG